MKRSLTLGQALEGTSKADTLMAGNLNGTTALCKEFFQKKARIVGDVSCTHKSENIQGSPTIT